MQKASVARKQTYLGKRISKQIESGEEPVKPVRKERVPLDPLIQEAYLEGKAILINKPIHWTSFDVVRKLRGMLQIKKIGHAGTLDPLASGLLIICTGKFTKKINEYMAAEKEYTGSITLGAVTPTYDLESEPEQPKDFSFVTDAMLHQAAAKFTGQIDQYPPVYSAIKKEGVALYKLARRGEEVELEPRKIFIRLFEITSVALPVVQFRVICSTGTYIRSLAHDFGKELGCGGYLSSLCRTRIGEFRLDDALSMDEFEQTLKSLNL